MSRYMHECRYFFKLSLEMTLCENQSFDGEIFAVKGYILDIVYLFAVTG